MPTTFYLWFSRTYSLVLAKGGNKNKTDSLHVQSETLMYEHRRISLTNLIFLVQLIVKNLM